MRLLRFSIFTLSALALFPAPGRAFNLSGARWPAGTRLVMPVNLGVPILPLLDRNPNWNDAVIPAFSFWNQQMQGFQFIPVGSAGSMASSGDGVSSVTFSPTVFGQTFGSNVLAITVTLRQGSNLREADVLFNQAELFDSYRGPLLPPIRPRITPIPDIRRVFLHELGHAIGLEDAGEDSIMNPFISNQEVLAPDDIAGARAMYGASTPVITSPLSFTGMTGQQFVYQFEATGATSFAASNLPPGLTFNPNNRAISGTPSLDGNFQVMLSASNSSGTTNAALDLTLQPPPSSGPLIRSGTSATGRTGRPFSFQVYSMGGTPAARLSAVGLPPGLGFDPVTGLISGTARADGSFGVALTVIDGAAVARATLQLTFISDPEVPVIISSSTLILTEGQPYSYTIQAPSTVGDTDPTRFELLFPLPRGLTFDANSGTISGTFTSSPTSASRNPLLSGGVITNNQAIARNSRGVSSIPLELFLRQPGVANISTRLAVGADPKVLIGGFIVTGNAPKQVIIRAVAPSLRLNGAPVPGTLSDPTLELVGSGLNLNGVPVGSVISDDWRATQEQEIIDSTVAPSDNREAAIVAVLEPGGYTAIVRGKNGETGLALVEVFDLRTASLENSATARLANISTRGFVQTGNDVMIGGFIVVGSVPSRVIVRAIGPDLTSRGVLGALQDTTLELRDGNGGLVASNDDWESSQRDDIIATTVPPNDPRESAIVANLLPGNYTAIVRGKNNTTGVALVEVFALQ